MPCNAVQRRATLYNATQHPEHDCNALQAPAEVLAVYEQKWAPLEKDGVPALEQRLQKVLGVPRENLVAVFGAWWAEVKDMCDEDEDPFEELNALLEEAGS